MLKVRVVKIGGNELDRPDWVARCARALNAAGGPLVVVHGGGQAVSAWSRRLGLPVEQRDGLRVTTPDIAQVVEMVLAGPMNRLLVSALRAAGLDAIGLSGVDGGLLAARPLAGSLGHVGEVTAVRASLLHSLLLAGLTPVIAPVAPAEHAAGAATPLNVNADAAAAAVAAALHAQELLFVSDVAGVGIDGVPQAAIPSADVEALVELGTVSGGMAAKLRAAAHAVQAGVRAVRIGDLDMLENVTAGTRLVATPPAPQPA